MNNIKTRYAPDTMEHIKKSDLIQLSRNILDATVQSTKVLEIDEMTPMKLQEAKLVLGFLNSANNVMKTKMQFFKMAGLEKKVEAIKSIDQKKYR